MNIPIEDLPEGWTLTHLIRLDDDDWQVNLRGDHHVVVATGMSPSAAVYAGCIKIEAEEYVGTLYHMVRDVFQKPIFDPRNLLESLGLSKPTKIQRRKGL